MKNWVPVLKSDKNIDLKVLTKTLPTKGNIVYEYNPLRNYRLTKNMFEFKNSLYSLYELYKIFHIWLDIASSRNGKVLCKTVSKSGAIYYRALSGPDKKWKKVEDICSELDYCYEKSNIVSRNSFETAVIDARFYKWIDNSSGLSTYTCPILHEKGELTDFITDELQFSLRNPVNIVPQYSYDGSVNLILNDGVNIPRLINSRFSSTGKDTYEIVDRKGDNDTNIYDQGEQFDIDTSLYKRTTKIPKLQFGGVTAGGDLPIGNYHFYFKFADADGNETDFIAESGLVSLFIGYDSPSAICTGISEENSVKSVKFYLTNIDASYNFVHVYYSRSSAQPNQSAVTQYCKIEKNFVVNNSQQCNILITGFETTTDVSAEDINLQYNIASAAKTAVECQNMLMMGNIHKPDIPYDELADLSLRFLPYVKEVIYPLDIDKNYNIKSNTRGYYDPDFIYSNVGYWNEEYYRFGIVYILPNNELSPVFNIRGRCDVYPFGINTKPTGDSVFKNNKVNDGQYNHYNVYKTENGNKERVKIHMNESTFYTLDPKYSTTDSSEGEVAIDRNYYENTKGVVTFHSVHDTDKIFALDIRTDDETIQELKKYVKGYFFVRQERIPTILCQGITIGIDNNACTPTLPTQGGFLSSLADSIEGSTYVEVEDINDVNYISEGFLSRYTFSLSKKSSGFWSVLGKVVTAVAVIAAVAAATVVTCGAAAVGTGIVTATSVLSAATTVGIAGAVAVGATAATGAIIGAIVESTVAVKRALAVKKLNGRNTKIPSGYKRKEQDTSRKLSKDFKDRIIIMSPNKNSVNAILCPDYEVNQAYFNQLFTGNKHIIKTTETQSTNRLQGFSSDFFSNEDNYFFIPSYYDTNTRTSYTCQVQGVPDDIPMVGIGKNKFRSRAGFAEEAWHYESIGHSWDDGDKKINSDIIRGSFGPYLAITGYPKNPCDTVNIMIPGYSDTRTSEYVAIRMDDSSSYFAISDRYAIADSDEHLTEPLIKISDTEDRTGGYSWELYRGDCYICQVTHRLNRNFNDPSAPYNHTIIDEDTWKKGYNPDDVEKYQDINLGDVNAVRLGMWVTFKIRSSYNHNVRTVDNSHTDEKLMCGHGRGFYPYIPMDTEGNFKTPESAVYNSGFKKSVSDKYNFALPDTPYIKNWFGNRIMYSDIHINDAYKNGFRVFRGTSYIDCPRTYGEIVKLVELKGSLLVVFEHGIGVIQVNPSNVGNNRAAGHDYMNVSNVLSQPTIISDVLGSQWADSILKTPGNFGDNVCYVYGVDTVSKKIWRTNGITVECISDTRVQEFLNNNISLGEREKTPIIGIRNVKTCYNSFKRDVMFTFYDNLQGFEEKVWNLCWNELLQMFVTFYSWVPSYMENINNLPFSFNRNTSKWVAKLGASHADNSFADGITLTNNILENNWSSDTKGTTATAFKAKIIKESTAAVESVILKPDGNENTWTPVLQNYEKGLIGILGVTNINLPTGKDIIYKIDYSLERDNFRNDKFFKIKKIGYYKHQYSNSGEIRAGIAAINDVKIPVWGLYLNDGVTVKQLSSELYYRNNAKHTYADWETNKLKPTVLNLSIIIDRQLPVFKDRAGKRLVLENREDMINPTHIVRLLNIKAKIYGYYGGLDQTVSEYFYNYAREHSSSNNQNSDTVQDVETNNNTSGQWIDCGFYESVVAVIPRWNMQFLSTDFWKHGQGGLIDIADKIYPAYWYGEQHPFEFEFVVVNDASTHKIFTNLEIVSNNVKPESFHYEIVGDVYDFAKDKVNMYFRQEAMKALYQYNGADILYNRNFLETQPHQQKLSADLPHNYYARQDTFNEIYDSYKQATSADKDYDHLTGSEIVYYPTRQEYRIWTHQKAVSSDDFEGDSTSKLKDKNNKYIYKDDEWESARAVIASNCKYQEDRWRVTINPIVVCYRNEYNLNNSKGLSSENSLWTSPNRPPLPVFNSPLPLDNENKRILANGLTDDDWPKELKDIGYSINDLDSVRWLDSVDIHGYQWGGENTSCNREEVDIRDKFVKVRIRYTGDQLAVIDFINTIYQLSLA
nr:MAG TPA: stabilization protein [Caudoviricetes sp.]